MTEAPEVRRIALIVSKGLSAGAAANVTALIMGQLAVTDPSLYDGPIRDGDGLPHAGIKHSTVVLTGRPGQLASLASSAEEGDLQVVAFSQLGRGLNNAFDTYRDSLAAAGAHELAGVGISGEDSQVRQLTKKFSVLS